MVLGVDDDLDRQPGRVVRAVPACVRVADEVLTLIGEDADPVCRADSQVGVLVLADRAVALDRRGGLDQPQDLAEHPLVEAAAELDAEVVSHRATVYGSPARSPTVASGMIGPWTSPPTSAPPATG